MADETQDENLKETDPSAVSDQGVETAPPTVKGAEAEGSPASEPAEKSTEKTKVSHRESLIKQLTGEAEDDTPKDEPEAEAADKSEETGDVIKAEDAPDDAPVAKPAAKTEETTDDDVPPEGTKGKAAKRWEAVMAERKTLKATVSQLEPHAKFGKQLGEFAAAAGMDAPALGAWMALGAEVHRDPKQMPTRLFAEAKRLAEHFKIQLPIEQKIESPLDIQALEDALVDDIAELNLPAEIGKKYLAKIREAKKKLNAPVVPVAKAPEPQTYLPPPVVATEQSTRTQPIRDAAQVAADTEIRKLDVEFAAKYGQPWVEKIRPVVQKAMGKYKGTDPKDWPDFLKTEVKTAIEKLGLAKKATTPAVVPTTLRPSTTTKPEKAKTARAGIVKELTGG